MKNGTPADICLTLEGTYPYIPGGVSSWTHHLIQAMAPLTFSLVTIVPGDKEFTPVYSIPDNVVSLQNVTLSDLPDGAKQIPQQKGFFGELQQVLNNVHDHPSVEHLAALIDLLKPHKGDLGKYLLLNSPSAWKTLQAMYMESYPKESFLDYFWSWRALNSALFSILLQPIPPAKVYHSLCTGYGGLFLARAQIETGKPCILTEHGIYTNERRIEIGSADWLDGHKVKNYNVENRKKDLRDYWIDSFTAYSKICYEACSAIVTLFESNQQMQLNDGAAQEKLKVIPNGIDVESFLKIERRCNPATPTVALVGRVVPIKDIKTFLRGGAILKNEYPGIRIWILGNTTEDDEYFAECKSLAKYLRIEENLTFLGEVNIKEYFPEVDVMVLTSISEAQPLVLLEAGAAGIPSVATNVGDVEKLLGGRSKEDQALGPGGLLCGLSDPADMAQCVSKLLSDRELSAQYGASGKQRVQRYYTKELQNRQYRDLYESLLAEASQIASAE